VHVQQTIYITFLLLHQRARPSGANDTETLDETVINDIKSSAAKHKENGAGARQRRGALSQVPVPVPAPPPSYNAPRSTAAQTQIGNKQSSAETQLQKEQPSDAATGAAAAEGAARAAAQARAATPRAQGNFRNRNFRAFF